MGRGLQATGRVEARGTLIRDRLIVDEPVCAGRPDGLFVELLGIERATFEARDLGSDKRGTILEVHRAVLGPLLELAMMCSQCLPVPGTFRGGSRIAEHGSCQRGVELVVRLLKDCRRRPRPKPVCVRGCRYGGSRGPRE